MLPDAELTRILVVTAHPDDADFGAAGSIVKWVQSGIEVIYCICTDGDAGGFDPDVPRSEIPGIRRAEQIAAAGELGVKDVRFLGYADGHLTVSTELRRDLSRVIRDVRPQRLLCHSPEWNFDRIYASHPDHRVAGEAALCAVYPDARNPFAHPELADEGFEAWEVSETWILGAAAPNHFVDVTDVFDRKLAALRAHMSQTAHLDVEALLRERMGEIARGFDLPPGRLAEAFRVMDTK